MSPRNSYFWSVPLGDMLRKLSSCEIMISKHPTRFKNGYRESLFLFQNLLYPIPFTDGGRRIFHSLDAPFLFYLYTIGGAT
jgi:hypothetical protein